MTHGITYAGEIGRVGDGATPQDVVELICTDPRFLEKAAVKKPNFLVRLFRGATSFPLDWWYGASFLAMRTGMFGAEGRAATDASARTAKDLINTADANITFAFRTIRTVLGHLTHYPEFWARTGTQLAVGAGTTMFTGPFVGMPVALLNFYLATTGAVIRAIDNGATSFAEIVVAAALGHSDPHIAQMASQELSLRDIEVDSYAIPDEREEFILHLLRGVLHCIRNPSEYMNTNDKPAYVVPVGQVSSSRPRGVMGNIPVGYETNALDVLSDEAYRSRR